MGTEDRRDFGQFVTGSALQRRVASGMADELLAGRMSRRLFLRRATMIGLSSTAIGAILAACGGDDDGDTTAAGADTTGAASTAGADTTAATSADTTAETSAETSAETTAETSAAGGVLRVSSPPPTAFVEPVTMFDAGAIAVVQQVAEYMIWVEPDGTLRGVLAESWEPDDEGSTWRFTLREGVTFQDGAPLTAADVVATFERLVDPESASAALSNFEGVLSPGGITAVDDLTVEFALDRAFADFPVFVASPNYNAVILPASYAIDWEANPVGTGPFRLTNYTVGQAATFERNEEYWGGTPPLSGVEIRFYDDEQGRELALQGGEVDMLLLAPSGSSALYSDDSVDILSAPGAGYNELFFGTDRAPLDNAAIRRALALCLDRQAILDTLFQGRGSVGNDHPFAPIFPVQPDVEQRTQDYEAAAAALEEGGLPDGFDITLTTQEFGGNPEYAVLFQDMVRQINVNVTLDILPQAEFYGVDETAPWLNAPLGIVDWAARAVPQQFIVPAYSCSGIWNSAKWCNEEYDSLLIEYDATIDEARRGEIATRMAEIMLEETPAVISYWTDAVRIVRKGVAGVQPSGSGFLDLAQASIDSAG